MTEPVADALVIFGASGDLARRELFPALHAIAARRDLPRVVGTARPDWTDADLLAHARSGIEEHGGGVDDAALERLGETLTYVPGDLTDPALYDDLAAAIDGASTPVHYLAIPPALFDDAVSGLAGAGLDDGARVVVEKPFGRDVASARELSAVLRRAFPDDAIFRIDHFLGLDSVQNLLVLRFANEVFEPVFNRDHVASVQITMAEDFGMNGRGGFYEDVGAVRDVLQNHLLQVLVLLTMEAPARPGSEALRDAKVALLRGLRPCSPDDVVRGQYETYRDEPGVAADSTVETFVAVRLHVDSRRWAGVPFHIRAGKRLPTTRTEAVVEFRRPPAPLLGRDDAPHPNHLRLEIYPGNDISLRIDTKRPGVELSDDVVSTVPADLSSSNASGGQAHRPLAYEPLLEDAIDGNASLFGRHDGIMAAWEVVQPILDDPGAVHRYRDGTWGPAEADHVAPPGGWHDPG